MVWCNDDNEKYTTIDTNYATVGRGYACLCKSDLQRCMGVSLTLGSALTTLIKKISADSGEWLGL